MGDHVSMYGGAGGYVSDHLHSLQTKQALVGLQSDHWQSGAAHRRGSRNVRNNPNHPAGLPGPTRMKLPSLLLLLFLGACSARDLPTARRLATSKLPNIAVVTTGGTIASIKGPDGTLIPAENGDQLIKAVVGLNTTANIVGIYAAAKIDSSEATPDFWKTVATVVLTQLKSATVDAVLVLHGTDSLEQTAWFLQCIGGIGDQSKPVVLTGAMRGADSPWPDGPSNILSAATVAVSPSSAGLGVMVVIQDQVFSARYVAKVNANNLAAFGGTDGGGHIAHVISKDVLLYFKPNGKLLCGGYPLPAVLPKIGLQAAYPGADNSAIYAVKKAGAKGIVIAGLGSGNIGAGLASAVRPLAANTTFRIVVTRVPEAGVTEPGYGCPGCLGALIDLGVIQALNLNAFQARIVLMLALAQSPKATTAELQAQYTKISYPYNPAKK